MTELTPRGSVNNPISPPLKPLTLSRRDFAAVSSLARQNIGIEFGPDKEQLVAGRLGKLVRRLGFASFKEYYEHLRADRSGEEMVQLVDVLTTNHTSFFREHAHFNYLVQHVFPHWDSRCRRRIWSAACSTGEEPYTIALIARECRGTMGGALPSILASDISTRVIETARKGIYPADRLEKVLVPWLQKHLLRGDGQWQGWYRMRPEIMSMVEFRRINLIETFPAVGSFDVIFCRNVMIYFSHDTQEQLVNRLATCLEPGGYLFVGHSESIAGARHGLEHIQPAIYRKRGERK